MVGLERRSDNLSGSGLVSSGQVLSGISITPQSALGLSAVFAAVNIISRDLASVPWKVYRTRKDGGRDDVTDHPVSELLSVSPDGQIDAFAFKQSIMGHVLGFGNGYARIDRSTRDGRPESLHLLHPSKTLPKLDENTGALYYQIGNNAKDRILNENMLGFNGLGFNGYAGYSPIQLMRQTLGLNWASEQAGSSLFSNGMIAKGVLKLKKKLSPTAITNLRNSMDQMHRGASSAFTTLILEEDMDWSNIMVNPDDCNWIESRRFGVLEVARIFSIPPHKLCDLTQSTFSNIEQSNADYLSRTLIGWVETIQSQACFKLLSTLDRQQGYFIACDISALQRGDSASRITYYQGMRNMGCLSADQILLKEGLNPIGAAGGGDKHLIQAQYVELSKAGESMAPPSVFPPPKQEQKSHADFQATAQKYGSLLRSHRNPIAVLSEDFLAADSGWREFSQEQLTELARSHSQESQERLQERRQLLREYSLAQRDERARYDKEQRQEAREYRESQAEALTTFEKEENPSDDSHQAFRNQQGLDLQEYTELQAIQRMNYCEEQQQEYRSLVGDLDEERARILGEQADERQVLIEDLVLELLQRSQDFPEVTKRLQSLPIPSSNGFSNGHD